ncbi:hypothetical protein RHSIM_Rhsim11G0089400 [Rhododendron simsii]|uniref:Uncharacterized protein n=1 Tax=Rhododendron simsii TaxID=118357 RepID=A0A834G6L3_RHOSS|nr:hypothetical protein RHSIM_Rhsim11G0089400 [Rhododendron simsii]
MLSGCRCRIRGPEAEDVVEDKVSLRTKWSCQCSRRRNTGEAGGGCGWAVGKFDLLSSSSCNYKWTPLERERERERARASCVSTTGLAHKYQLLSHLHDLRQEPDQSINDFLSQVYCVWDQLALPEPTWSCTADAKIFTSHRDQQRLIFFLMALTMDFEPIRGSLLHRSPLLTLEQAISELLSKETCLSSLKPKSMDTVLQLIITEVLNKSITEVTISARSKLLSFLPQDRSYVAQLPSQNL